MAELLHRMGAAQVVVEHWIAVSVSVQAVFYHYDSFVGKIPGSAE